MNFILADTFVDSIARLPATEQKQAKTAAYDLQVNPAHPGLKLHRIERARDSNETARVLLTTFSDTLAQALDVRLRRLIGNEPRVRERIDVGTLDGIARRLWRPPDEQWQIACDLEIASALEASLTDLLAEGVPPGPTTSLRFVQAEWDSIIDARRIESWEACRDVPRLGRRTRLPESRRQLLWSVYERARKTLHDRKRSTIADVYYDLVERFSLGQHSPWDHVVVDEAQDVSIPQLCFLAALRGTVPDGLFFAGDVAQRIFREPFSWASLGVEVRGRSRLLRVNYRTSHQIRSVADRLLDAEITDPDGLTDPRRTTISVFAGPPPEVNRYPDVDREVAAVAHWLSALIEDGISRSDSVRRRRDSFPGTNRSDRRRSRPRGDLRDRAKPPLRRLHARPRGSAGYSTRTGVGVPGGSGCGVAGSDVRS